MKKKESGQSTDDLNEFAFEISSSKGKDDIVDEIESFDLIDETIEEKPKSKTIKILSERDIQYKEAPPPNYYPKFKCILHYKGGNYQKRKMLKVAHLED